MPDSILVSYLTCFVVFSALGSFFNVVIYRLPLMMESAWRREYESLLNTGDDTNAQSEQTSFNIAIPNSHCPSCKTPIKPWQNIPIISYLVLKGRCSSCNNSIGIRYPLIELATALLGVGCLALFGLGAYGFATAALCWVLLILTAIDIDHQLLPDQLTLPLLWAGLLLSAVGISAISLHDAVIGAAAGYLSLWSVYWLFKLITGKEGMGYGDFKLLAALGAWMGWQQLPVIIILSSLVGAILGSLYMALNKSSRGQTIPFGPYLAGAGLITLFWGEIIVDNYLQFAGLR
ncbi:MAG: leader peptidase (prepilin peptidase)/N-methyltransferase [Paracoccaceae bacterium]|jgi:leader peptidase (prepilin peptidase)/N-methyltransferase